MSVTDTIKSILAEDVFVEVPPGEMREDDSLRDVYGLDSIGFVELRVQSEQRFGITIPDEEFTQESFATIRDLAALVSRLREGAATVPTGAPGDPP